MGQVEIIKPSYPTPSHLKNLQLSFLDQLAPPVHIHFILYFQPLSLQRHQASFALKRSLSEALSIYFPLAGRINENQIDCNDAGIEYSEAEFNDTRVADIVENSRPDELNRYVPVLPCGGPDVPLAVQVNFFGSGGIAIGVCMAHKVVDAMSMVIFVNAWAAACRGDAKSIALTQPSFGLASRFPPADFSRLFSTHNDQYIPEKIVSRRFLFDKCNLSTLQKLTSGPLLANPTKVEAVTAFLWRHYIESATLKPDEGNENKNRAFGATHVVDIRPRASPHLPRQYCGNALARVFAMVDDDASTNKPACNYYNLAVKLRDMIRKADSSYVAQLENGEKYLECILSNEENDAVFKDGKKTLETCSFTSWCRLPAYEVDYGWGKPVWVSIVGLPMKNLIVLLGTKLGDGIEAWVNMAEEDMVMVEKSYNLLQRVDCNALKL